MKDATLRGRFRAMDVDGSGKLGSREIMEQISGADRYKAEQIIAAMDVDVDGLVSYEEFLDSYHEESAVGVMTAADIVAETPKRKA